MTRSFSHLFSQSIATRLMVGTAVIAVLAFGATAGITYKRSSNALIVPAISQNPTSRPRPKAISLSHGP